MSDSQKAVDYQNYKENQKDWQQQYDAVYDEIEQVYQVNNSPDEQEEAKEQGDQIAQQRQDFTDNYYDGETDQGHQTQIDAIEDAVYTEKDAGYGAGDYLHYDNYDDYDDDYDDDYNYDQNYKGGDYCREDEEGLNEYHFEHQE